MELTEELRDRVRRENEAIAVGRLLHEAYSQELWRQQADTWREYVHGVGLSESMEYQSRTNYKTFVLMLGLDPSDIRLEETPPSKLAIGTRNAFRSWVASNLDEFLDLASLSSDSGGLTRVALQEHLKEIVGTRDSENDETDSLARKALGEFRRGLLPYSQLEADSLSEFVELFRGNEDLFEDMSELITAARALDDDNTVVIDDLMTMFEAPLKAVPQPQSRVGKKPHLERFEKRISDGTLYVDSDGRIVTRKSDGTLVRIGHAGNNRGNWVVKYLDEDGKAKPLQATRLAWRLHHGQWPPDDMSVMTISGDKGDFRRQNLMLVPGGQENRARVANNGPTRRSVAADREDSQM